jgi:hypothetical protein
LAFLGAAGLDSVRRMETSLVDGYLGLTAALFGDVKGPGRHDPPSVARWLSAAGLWCTLAASALIVVSSRRLRR